MSEKPLYKFRGENPGFYQVHYTRMHEGHRLVYCIQNDGGWGKDDYKFYRCSQDGEADYEVKMPEAGAFDRLVWPDSIEKKGV